MTPYGIRAVDDEPHGCPPWIMKVAVVCLILFGVIVVRMVIGLSVDYAYFRATQGFEDFVAENPVAPAALEAELPRGALLAEGSPWELGAAASEEQDSSSVWCEVSIAHGEEPLLEAMVKVIASESAGDPGSRTVQVSLERVTTDPRMRALVQVGVVPRGGLLESGGDFLVDVRLAAGPGEDSLRVVELDSVPAVWPDEAPSSWVRALLGVVRPMSELPSEGLIYHTRQRVSLDWSKAAGGRDRLVGQIAELRLNSHEYSSAVEAKFTTFEDGRQRLRQATSWTESYNWNEKAW